MPSLVNQTRGSRTVYLPRMLQVHLPNVAQCKEKALLRVSNSLRSCITPRATCLPQGPID